MKVNEVQKKILEGTERRQIVHKNILKPTSSTEGKKKETYKCESCGNKRRWEDMDGLEGSPWVTAFCVFCNAAKTFLRVNI